MAAAVVVRVKHGAVLHEVPLPAAGTVGDLQLALATQLGVPVAGQKLIVKGQSLRDPAAPLADTGLLRAGASALLLGRVFDPLADELGRPLVAARTEVQALATRLRAASDQVAAIAAGHVDGVRAEACRTARKALLQHEERLLQTLEALDAVALGPEHALLRDLRKEIVADISVRAGGRPRATRHRCPPSRSSRVQAQFKTVDAQTAALAALEAA
jgi:hypothetical protein